VLCAVTFGGALATVRGVEIADCAATPEASLAHALAKRGLTCEAGDVTWMGSPGGVLASVLGGGRAVVRASAGSEPSDLYLVDVRRSPEGRLLAVGDTWNLTGTSGVDESRPIVRGTRVAYATSADGLYTGVHVLDLAGRAPGKTADFTRMQRAQAALTNLQQTGQTRGVAHDTFALDPIARDVVVAWQKGGSLEARADGHRIIVDTAAGRVAEGEDFVRVVPDEQGRPGNLVTWAVDRVRAIPWVGDDRMQWVKAVAFTALDRFHAATAHGTTAEDVHDELGLSTATESPGPPTFVDPEVGWPPAPLKPPIAPALPGEGQWIALDKDRFITPAPGSPGGAAAFVTSYLRPSRERPDVRVYVTLWDSRQLALHMEAGTVEPISANGEHGPGIVPRKPEVLRHFVAAFNGGFQAQHGEYGMLSNGIEYLPPKPYAATVVELRNGSNGFGAWPNSAVVPDDVVGMRQNLTALVQGGKFNPWGRIWWGGTPPGWPDQIHSARSALCMTTEGFGAYFYSTNISAEDLAAGMLAARCAFGIHLDMNPGHAGFEFYDVAPDGNLPPLGRPLQPDWEAEGKVSGMPGYTFRARRMIRGMGHMLFPRYIQHEARDFFYLTSRTILPGVPLEGATEWRTRSLPQQGFPYALAIASTALHTTPTPTSLRILKVDPKTVRPGDGPAAVLSLSGPTRGSQALYWSNASFVLAEHPPAAATLVVRGYAPSEAPSVTAHAALGVDDDGMLAWVELPPGMRPDASTTAAMDDVLGRLHCAARMMVPGDARALLGGTLDAAGDPAPAAPTDAVRLVRAQAPDAHPIFTDTPLVPVSVWQPLQAKRVRYFYKPAAAPSASTAASAPNP
jgi:hypothetical protein